ncbi:MAG: carboxypeptidase regulatory-like domain-containing protein [Candidatus Neomarinimicrobiota bacterium]
MLAAILIATGCLTAQPGKFNKGIISGKIFDDVTGTVVEYTNIVVYSTRDSAIVTGCTSDQHGYFYLSGIATGDYFLTVKFIGYHLYRSEVFEITAATPGED